MAVTITHGAPPEGVWQESTDDVPTADVPRHAQAGTIGLTKTVLEAGAG